MAKITAGFLCIMVSACGSHFGQMPKKYHQQQREIDGAFHSLSGWRGSIPFFLDDTAPDELTEASMHAADTWNNGIGREILVFSGVAKINRVNQLYSSLDDSLTQIYFEKNWTALTKKPTTTLALTIWEYAK
ncbi:MAG: hypothetical protein NTX25_02985, partial [Proteobacteria bacterium]|nr:hypothetical protein [Pseudomonadota bacterium]